MLVANALKMIEPGVISYLLRVQEKAGSYAGSFLSAQAWHPPTRDWNAGSAHHYTAAALGGLALYRAGARDGRVRQQEAGVRALEWLVAQQLPTGGFPEIVNNDLMARWTNKRLGVTVLETTPAGQCVAEALTGAIRLGWEADEKTLACLGALGSWQLSLAVEDGSGRFPYHDGAAIELPSVNSRAAHTLAAVASVLSKEGWRFYTERTLKEELIALQTEYNLGVLEQTDETRPPPEPGEARRAARRAMLRTMDLQDENGMFPYWADESVKPDRKRTVGYTAEICRNFLSIAELLDLVEPELRRMNACLRRAAGFLDGCVRKDGSINWRFESTTAKHRTWVYLAVAEVLLRVDPHRHADTIERLMVYCCKKLYDYDRGLLSVTDTPEAPVYECAPLQARMLLSMLDMKIA